jgi:hypothetical protein
MIESVSRGRNWVDWAALTFDRMEGTEEVVRAVGVAYVVVVLHSYDKSFLTPKIGSKYLFRTIWSKSGIVIHSGIRTYRRMA